jgi:hypothetical protein
MTGSKRWRSPAEDVGRAELIRSLNDQFRISFEGGKVVLTSGLIQHAGDTLPSLLLRVRQFDQFSARSDAHGEHDFGAFEWDTLTIFWEIDCYDSDLLMGSPDPTDPAVTTRVLTVMLAEEY